MSKKTSKAKKDKSKKADTKKADQSKAQSKKSSTSKSAGFRGFFKKHKKKLGIATGVIVVLAALFFFVKPVQYAVLNLFTSAEVRIVALDSETSQPLNNAEVVVDSEVVAVSGEDGVAQLEDVAFGDLNFTVQKEAYESQSVSYEVSLGSNDVGSVRLNPTGIPLEVTAADLFSKESVDSFMVTIVDSQSTFPATEPGKTKVNLPPNIGETITLNIEADGYNSQERSVTIKENVQPIKLELTPAGKSYFLSNRTGAFNVYSSNLDGTDQQVVIEGTGLEGSGTVFSVSPSNTHAVLIGSRDDIRDDNGNLLNSVYMIDLGAKTIARVDDGARSFSTVGWSGDTFVYTASVDNSDTNKTSKLKTSNTAGNLNTVDTASNIGSSRISNGRVIYTQYNQLSDRYVSNLKMYDLASSSNVLNNGDAYYYSIFTTGPDEMRVNSDDGWYQLTPSTGKLVSADPHNSSSTSRLVYNQDQSRVALVEQRDGRGVLELSSPDGSDVQTVFVEQSVSSPVVWINDNLVIVYVSGADESSNYIVSLSNSQSYKISNVYKNSGYGRYGY